MSFRFHGRMRSGCIAVIVCIFGVLDGRIYGSVSSFLLPTVPGKVQFSRRCDWARWTLPVLHRQNQRRVQKTRVISVAVAKAKAKAESAPRSDSRTSQRRYRKPVRPRKNSKSKETALKELGVVSSSSSPSSSSGKNATKPGSEGLPSALKTLEDRVKSEVAELLDRHVRGVNLTQSYFDSVLAVCVSSDAWESVLEVLEVMKVRGLSQERSTYRQCLQSCLEVGNGGTAREILDAMLKAQVHPDPIDVSLAVGAICHRGAPHHPPPKGGVKSKNLSYRRALELIKSAPDKYFKSDRQTIPVHAYEVLLSTMHDSHGWKDALQLLHLMEEGFDTTNRASSRHPAPTLAAYRLVIETCASSGAGEQAFQVLLSMARRGLKPSSHTYELVISALAAKLQWRRATQLLEEMESLGIARTVETYNRVIAACSKAGEIGTAKNLIKKMRQAGIKPDIVTFNTLMSACAGSNHRWTEALRILDQIHREPGISPDVITYTNAIRACARGGNTRRALSLLQIAKDKKMKVDSYLYSAAIEACAKGKQYQPALQLLDEMKAAGIELSPFTYSVAISACGNAGKWQKALNLLDRMRCQDIEINLVTYNAAITALSKASRSTARKAGGNDPNELWRKALLLLEEIRNKGMEPDGFSYSAAISCCGAGGRWEEVLDLIRTMQEGGPRSWPNRIAYTAAISACGKANRTTEAHKLYTDMEKQGLTPDTYAVNVLMSAFRNANEADKAFALWNDIIEKTRTSSNQVVPKAKTARSMPQRPEPDAITVTDAIGAISRSSTLNNRSSCSAGHEHNNNDEERRRRQVDKVFHDAVQRGLILKTILDSEYEIDLSGLSFPVARAACRYILERIQTKASSRLVEDVITIGEDCLPPPDQDLVLITGVGVAGLSRRKEIPRNSNKKQSSLRDYIGECLRRDFDPPIESYIPERAQGTVCVPRVSLLEWLNAQKTL